jgi:hypothetical protein
MNSSALRVLLDQGLPRDTAEQLRTGSVECRHVGEIGMSAASDTEILNYAAAKDFIIATLDADFHTMLRWWPGPSLRHTNSPRGTEEHCDHSDYLGRFRYVCGRPREWLHDHCKET